MKASIRNENTKMSRRRRSRSSDYAKRGRFMFLSCRAWQRKVQRCITHVQALPLFLSLKVLSGDVLVANGQPDWDSNSSEPIDR